MTELRLSGEAAQYIRDQIERAGGREVCFLARVDRNEEERIVEGPRAVSRGNYDAVLAAARDAEQGGVMIHNHPSGLLEPSRADMAVASRLYDVGLGTVITDNHASRLYVVVEPPEPRVVEPLETEALDRVLGPGGTLSALHPAYEDRPGQRQMLKLVAERYNEGGVLVVEAGTGTGKSLAYLLPAAAWALRNGERTVVSTNTINLQEQLVAQDLPLVGKLLREGDGGEELSWALVKGRGNYVSIRRARLAYQQSTSLFEEDRGDELKGILDWIEATEDGSLSDLGFVPSTEVWEEVRSDSDICLRARCPHFQECFYQRSRRRAASADLVVVNHHLLFTDVAVRRATQNYSDSAVLPAYRHLVLDEAHNVEDAATSHLGVELTRIGLFRTLSRLGRNGRGVLAALDDSLRGDPDRGSSTEIRKRMETRVRPALEEAVSAAERFFDALEPRLPGRDGEALRLGGTVGGRGEPQRRGEHPGPPSSLAVDGKKPEGASDEPADDLRIREALDGLLGALSALEREVAELQRRIELDESWAEALEGRLLDLQSVQRRLAGAVHALRLVLLPDDDTRRGYVRWL
ncbi:MAG: DEAD/DEAH box helicase, partial [Longimicrobiales bacterium]|nr:DEAD/DEAH box helicase [Longimicrobiales bacterium]